MLRRSEIASPLGKASLRTGTGLRRDLTQRPATKKVCVDVTLERAALTPRARVRTSTRAFLTRAHFLVFHPLTHTEHSAQHSDALVHRGLTHTRGAAASSILRCVREGRVFSFLRCVRLGPRPAWRRLPPYLLAFLSGHGFRRVCEEVAGGARALRSQCSRSLVC